MEPEAGDMVASPAGAGVRDRARSAAICHNVSESGHGCETGHGFVRSSRASTLPALTMAEDADDGDDDDHIVRSHVYYGPTAMATMTTMVLAMARQACMFGRGLAGPTKAPGRYGRHA